MKRSTVMVLGAGDTSEKAAKALLSRGANRLLVANRTLERAQQLASELGGSAVPFDQLPERALEVDIVVSTPVEATSLKKMGRIAVVAIRTNAEFAQSYNTQLLSCRVII